MYPGEQAQEPDYEEYQMDPEMEDKMWEDAISRWGTQKPKNDTGESWTSWVLVRKDRIPEEYTNEEIVCRFFHCYDRGPGRAFGHEPIYKIVGNKMLIKQFCGLDI
jgi:hypothetical protein